MPHSLLFAANPIPRWVFDTETLRFLDVNEAASATYGFSRDEFLGMTIADIRPPDDGPRRTGVPAPEVTGSSEPALWRHRRKDGTLLTVQFTAQAIVFNELRAPLVLAQDLDGAARMH